MRLVFWGILFVLTLGACTKANQVPELDLNGPNLVQVVPPETLVQALAQADPQTLAAAIEASLTYVRLQPAAARPAALGPVYTWADLGATLEHLRFLLPQVQSDPSLLLQEFVWYEVGPQPLITGYYEPEIEASLMADPSYPVPIYGRPQSLQQTDLGAFHPQWAGQTLVYRIEGKDVVPFYSRAEIETQGVLEANQEPIAWAKDEVDVYFLQVQGSGRLRLPDGSSKHILYAGKNGRPYVSLGQLMLQRGLLTKEEMSMQSIRAYLHDYPDEVQELLHANPSYVFFHLAEAGPLGSMGQILTPLVSLATDSALLPLGSLLAMELELPSADGSLEPASILGLAQDRGGAIKGSRLDLFCGTGPQAEYWAGHLQSFGRAFLLLKK